MGAVTVAGMLACEASAIANGWTEEQLLNLAGERLGLAIGSYFAAPGTAVAYTGKGHNAGDALVALRILRDRFGWKIFVRPAFPMHECAPLTLGKWDELDVHPLDRPPVPADLPRPLVLLDGLLGSGASGPPRDAITAMIGEMTALRNQAGARVAAVDLPSGTDPDSGEIHPGGLVADVTFMIGAAKIGLLTGHAASSPGALALVEVDPLAAAGESDLEMICPQLSEFGKRPRPFDFHKGDAGRVSVLAGSDCYGGAAALAASGALRAGAGLVTLFVPASARALVSAKCPPEVIIRGYEDPRELLEMRADAIVAGCGLGEIGGTDAVALLDLIARVPVPAVLDADALNLIARRGAMDILNDKHLLTPHPGEFARLAPELAELPRVEAVRRFCGTTTASLSLKG